MRVAVIGGTRFIGWAVVEDLAAAGHEVLVVHRGVHEPGPGDGVLAEVAHLHANRRELTGTAGAGLAAFAPEAVVDLCAMTGPDAEAVLAAVPRGRDPHLVVASSQDVYRAFGSILAGRVTDELPIDESSPVREAPLPRPRGGDGGWDYDEGAYEKLDVERAYLARGGTVLRLPFTYGERDTQRREEALLARVRAGRGAIPVGPGTLLWSKGWVRDIAAAVRLTVQTPAAAGEILNLCELRTAPMDLWVRRVLAAAGVGERVELVRVPDELVPPDLLLTRAYAQHLLVGSSRARQVLGWSDTDPVEAITRSVAWHLEHPPQDSVFDPAADDRALAAATPA